VGLHELEQNRRFSDVYTPAPSMRLKRSSKNERPMTAIEFFHFAHVFAFALIMVDMTTFYATRRAAKFGTSPETRILAARTARWSNAFSSFALAALLPLGVELGADLGVYRVTHDIALTVTWIIGLSWLVLVLAADMMSTSKLGHRLYTIEIWVRVIIGLGNIYDALTRFLGAESTLIETNWLAVKVLVLGVVLVFSGMVRARLRPVRLALAELNPLSAQKSTWDDATAAAVMTAVGRTRLLVHINFTLVLIAAWMGINKPW
jgi:hypothetical protein